MTESGNVGQELQGQILDRVRKSQAALVDAIQTWATTVRSITPDLPLPDMNQSITDKLPRPQELIAGAYDFAEQLLASQRKFAEDVLKATAPLLPGQDDAAKNAK
jgi:hypothetical protein